MKSVFNILTIVLLAAALGSCAAIDNYDIPEETIRGTLYDADTHQPVPCETGGTQIRLMEYSWSDSPTPYYFNVKPDGTFNNTRIFEGTYGIMPIGPFVPFQQQDDEGKYVVNNEVVKDVSGEVSIDFEVEPFLRIEWVEDPYITSEGKVMSKIRISRGTDNPNYQDNIDYISFFVSSTQYVGNNDYIAKYSTRTSFTGDAANEFLDIEYEIGSRSALAAGRKWFVRAAARTTTVIEGTSRYNYSTIKEVSTVSD